MLSLRTADGRTLSIGVVATDLDRTLTDPELNVVPEALDAFARLRGHGVRTVLATGRTEQELVGRSALWETFDGFVLEGGALVGWGRRLAVAPEGRLRMERLEAWLLDRGIAVNRGAAFLSVSIDHWLDLGAYPDLEGLSVNPNRDRVDITARGIDKGAGLRALLGPDPGGLLAFGDAENDRSMFQLADHAVAVANAEDDLKAKAHEVLALPGGQGVAEFLRTRLLPAPANGPPSPVPAKAREVAR